jgi:hypothetical protein
MGALYLITLGTIAIVVMLKAPRKPWRLIGDGLNTYLFPLQRGVRLDFSNTVTFPTFVEVAAFRPNEQRHQITTEK